MKYNISVIYVDIYAVRGSGAPKTQIWEWNQGQTYMGLWDLKGRVGIDAQSASAARIHGWLNFSVFAVHSERGETGMQEYEDYKGICKNGGAEARRSSKTDGNTFPKPT